MPKTHTDASSVNSDASLHEPDGYTLPGWQKMARTVRNVDEVKIEDCRDDINTLLVFAGLFSAVLTAFVVESYKALQPDTDSEIVGLLRQSLALNYAIGTGTLNSTMSLPQEQPFSAQPWAIWVNGLWFASLICSLSTASIGMFVKQWLREYLAIDSVSPQERLRVRQYRAPGLTNWKVFEISAALPLLLDVSLGLFFAGLCVFTASVDARIGRSTLPLVAAWAFFIFTTLMPPLFTPRCPFKIPLSKTIMVGLRTYLIRPVYALLALPDLREEEEDVLKTTVDQVDILLSVDEELVDDGLLGMMWEVLGQSTTSPQAVFRLVLGIIQNRIVTFSFNPLTGESGAPSAVHDTWRAIDLGPLSKICWDSVQDLVAQTVQRSCPDLRPEWVEMAARLWMTTSPFDLPPLVRSILSSDTLIEHILTAIMNSTLLPEEIVAFIILILQMRCGDSISSSTQYGRLSYPLDLSSLSKRSWEAVVRTLVHILCRYADSDRLGYAMDVDLNWPQDTIRILVANSPHSFPDVIYSQMGSHKLALMNVLKSFSARSLHAQEIIMFVGICANLRLGSTSSPPELPSILPRTSNIVDAMNALSDQELGAVVAVISDTIHLRRGTTQWMADSRPEWAADAAFILILTSAQRPRHTGGRPDGLRVYLASSARRTEDVRMGRSAGTLLAQRLMPSSDAANFYPVAERLKPVLVESPACLQNILVMYVSLLRTITAPLLAVETSWSLFDILRRNPHLVSHPRARLLFDDVWSLLHAYCMRRYLDRPENVELTQMVPAVRVILQLGILDREGSRREDASNLFIRGALSESTLTRVLALLMVTSIDERARAVHMSEFDFQSLIFGSLAAVNDKGVTDLPVLLHGWLDVFIEDSKASLFSASWLAPEERHVLNSARFHFLDPIRMCWIFLRLYDYCRIRRNHIQELTGESLTIERWLYIWRRIWLHLAHCMRTYSTSLFDRRQPDHVGHRLMGNEDLNLAEDCLTYMELLEWTVDAASEDLTLFPDELIVVIARLEGGVSLERVLKRFRRRVGELLEVYTFRNARILGTDLWRALRQVDETVVVQSSREQHQPVESAKPSRSALRSTHWANGRAEAVYDKQPLVWNKVVRWEDEVVATDLAGGDLENGSASSTASTRALYNLTWEDDQNPPPSRAESPTPVHHNPVLRPVSGPDSSSDGSSGWELVVS